MTPQLPLSTYLPKLRKIEFGELMKKRHEMKQPTGQVARLFSIVIPFAFLQGSIIPASADTEKKSERNQGIWKAAVPPGGMKGEFDNHDPIGLATGAKIKVDCSLNWPNPDTGKVYCFNSATSLVYFLDWPQKNIENAAKAWKLIRDAKQTKK